MVLAVIWALLGRSSQLAAAWHAGNRAALLAEMAPVLFIGNAILGFAAFRYWRGGVSERASSDPVGAVFASALLFAARIPPSGRRRFRCCCWGLSWAISLIAPKA